MDRIGNSFSILESVDSTNNYAMAKVHAGLAKHGDVYLARTQTAGKGQRGKSWNSMPDTNITLSCIVEPKTISLANPFFLSLQIALACYDLVNHYALSDVSIKWPNDLYWRDRKTGGILIENRFQGTEWQYAVVGIGLNINQTVFAPSINNPVSLKQVTGATYDILIVARELCDRIEERISEHDWNNSLDEYNSLLYKSGERVRLKVNDVEFETTIKGVNSLGQLVTFNKVEQLFNWGEVAWII